MVHCTNCDNRVPYCVKEHVVNYEINGIKFSYREKSAHCLICGSEVYVPWVADVNVGSRRYAYAKAANLTR